MDEVKQKIDTSVVGQEVANEPIKRRISLSTIIIFVLLGIIGVLGFLLVSAKLQTPGRVVKNSPMPTAAKSRDEVLDSNTVLVPYIPHFKNLSINDLPNFVDVRAVYPYNGNKIIIGIDRIAEYNAQSHKMVRVSNPDAALNIYSGALVGNYLWVTGTRPTNNENDFPPKSEMNKIDIRTGKIVKTFFRDDPRRLVNLYVVEKEGKLWLYSNDGAFSFDPTSEKITPYSNEQLGNPGCKAHGIYKYKEQIKLAFLCDGDKASTYDDVTDTWKLESFDSTEWSSAINRRLNDFGLDEIPTYSLISNIVNNKYYLFSDKGIFTLKSNEMPNYLSSAVVTPTYDVGEGKSKVYVASNEKYALIIGQELCGPGACPLLSGLVVNLESGLVSNLLKDNKEYNSLTDTSKAALADAISESEIKEDGNNVSFYNPKTNKGIAFVNLVSKEFHLSN